MKIAIALKAARLLRAAIKKDASNRYDLKHDWILPIMRIDVPANFENELVRVEKLLNGFSRWTIKAYTGDVCDGASLSPDHPKGVLDGALAHDPLYLSLEEMATAWGIPVSDVRKMADRIFSTIIHRAGGNRLIARLYYNGVYYGGAAYCAVKRVFALAAPPIFIITALGWSGCQSPPDDSDPNSPYVPPKWEKTR